MLRSGPSISLGIFLSEVLADKDPVGLKAFLDANFDCITHLLDGGRALTVNYTNTPSIPGVSEANLVDLERQGAVTRHIHRIDDCGSLSVSVPDLRYRITAVLPRREVMRQAEGMFMSSQIVEGPEVGLVLLQSPRVTQKILDQERAIVSDWYTEAVKIGFGGEKLNGGGTLVEPTPNIRFTVPYPNPVTYPWLELYLRLRSNLKRGQRPHLSFKAAEAANLTQIT